MGSVVAYAPRRVQNELESLGLKALEDLCTIGTTPWTSYQPVARPLPKHRTTQAQNKRTHTHTHTHTCTHKTSML
jgi:hypothetical protein